MEDREIIITNYVEGYNSFDVPKMIVDFSNEIIFENIQNGITSMSLKGIQEFKAQAEMAKSYFSARQQLIKSFSHEGKNTEVEIEYFGVLAVDFSEEMKKGQEIKLKGKSIFEFSKNKIIRLTDIS